MTATYAKFTLQLNTVTDADVIEYLKAQANKNDTIRRALLQQRAMDAYAESKEQESKDMMRAALTETGPESEGRPRRADE